LTRGQNTLVDSRDYPQLARWRWCAQRRSQKTESYDVRRTTYKDGRSVGVKMHTVILTAKAGPRPPGMVSRHLNGDSLDNRSGNLVWGTPRENTRDAIEQGTFKHNTPFRPGNTAGLATRFRPGNTAATAKLGREDVLAIYGSDDPIAALSARFGVSRRAVWDIRRGRCWSWLTGAKRDDPGRQRRMAPTAESS
jgi:hypothetical protein